MIKMLQYAAKNASPTLRDAALATIFPATCRVCDTAIESWHDGVACDQCWLKAEQKISRIRAAKNFCSKCGMPLARLSRQVKVGEQQCGRCDDMSFTVARACGVYEGALRECVLWLKMYPQIPARLRVLLRGTLAGLTELSPSDSIIPVPLHEERFEERTLNQADVIAVELSRLSGLQVDRSSLIRTKQTERHRAGMGARERSRSLEKAFRVRAPRLIAGKSVLLVDDVMTTGSTANAIARILLSNGANTVNVLTLARAASEFSI